MNDTIAVLYEDVDLRIHADPASIASASTVLVSFTGIGHGMGGIDVQRIEFSGTAHRHGGLIVVTDKNRSWGNNISSEKLVGLIEPLVRGKTVITIGNSMGGFLALLFAPIIGARLAIAFAPQFSVDASIVPDETRWMEYRKNINSFRYPSLKGRLDKKRTYYTINGATPLEEIHWKRFPVGGNLHHFVVSGIGHDVALQLKKAGILNRVIDDALKEKLDLSSFADIPVYKRSAKSFYSLARERLSTLSLTPWRRRVG